MNRIKKSMREAQRNLRTFRIFLECMDKHLDERGLISREHVDKYLCEAQKKATMIYPEDERA